MDNTYSITGQKDGKKATLRFRSKDFQANWEFRLTDDRSLQNQMSLFYNFMSRNECLPDGVTIPSAHELLGNLSWED